MVGAFAAWLEVLAVDLLDYALMENHIHLILRTRPGLAASWLPGQVRRRLFAAATVADGRPCRPDEIRSLGRLSETRWRDEQQCACG